MRKDFDVKILSSSFPNQLASDAEKATEEYGLKVGQSIQYEWFKGGGSASRFFSRWDEFHKRRLYARGEQSVAKYKNEIAVDGDLSYLNLDWTPVPIIPKFVDIVVNGMSNRLFKVKAFSQDELSQSKRTKYQEMIEGQMVSRDVLDLVQEKSGVNPYVTNPDELPKNDEELALYMQLNFKPSVEIAEEEAINTVLEENEYLELRKRLDYDATVLGMSVVKHEFLPGSGIKLSYVDAASFIHSYTEDPHFRDCYYHGEVKTIPIADLVKIKPKISKDEMQEISQFSQSWYRHNNTGQYFENDIMKEDTCTLLYFNYKTTNRVVYKKKKLDNGGERVIEKDDTFNPPEELLKEGKFEKIDKTIEVWYEGIMVAGTDIILKWEMAKNMVRPKSASQHAMPMFLAAAPRMYKGSIESLVSRMIPFGDLIQITHLKLQQVVSKVIPDGVYLDVDGINEVDLGTGQAYNPQDALRLYFQTGSVIGRSMTQDGEFNHGKMPIQELSKNSGGAKVQMLIANYNHYLDMIRAVTGLNEARDASTPNENTLVGVQKLAALNSNTATKHILDAGLYLFKKLAEAVSYRVSDVLEYADFKQEFISQIGKYNVGILDDIKDLYLYDFGVFLEVAPDEEEKQMLEQNIQMALSRENIDIEDAIDIREIKNIKIANQLLKVKRKSKQDREIKNKEREQAMQAQYQQMSQQQAAQARMEENQAEIQGKSMLAEKESELKIAQMKAEAALKSQLMDKEFQYNMTLRGVETKNLIDKEMMKEDRKDERIDRQSTQTSKIVDQKKNNLPPVNFESEEDTLDGFSMEGFGPR